MTESLNKLIKYIENEHYKGYDPYDTLNSWFPFHWFGKWGSPIAIQIQKRNPINIRSLIGIKKGMNPKGIGLLLKAYSLLYKKTEDDAYLKQADFLFEWLVENYSKGYSGYCWGYNFDWATPGDYLPAYTPSVVVTSFVIDGIYTYFEITKNKKAFTVINSAVEYIINDIPVTKFPKGISFAYTHQSKGSCYNASLLAVEILAKTDVLNGKSQYTDKVKLAVDFVLSKQKENGEWWYSYNSENKTERNQIDFHQGFVLVSLENLKNLVLSNYSGLEDAIKKGLEYYKNAQFYDNGRSLWRIPKKWPVEIHNQSQGIITFSKLSHYDSSYMDFANTIATWTIENMQDKSGYFYYRKTPLFTNKISYMRWSQAWMILGLTELIMKEK